MQVKISLFKCSFPPEELAAVQMMQNDLLVFSGNNSCTHYENILYCILKLSIKEKIYHNGNVCLFKQFLMCQTFQATV